MRKLEISIQSPFVTKNPRADRKPTVFNRILSKLSEQHLHPGKILPIFIKIDGDHKIFGALTLNTGGSVSFFPDFHKLDKFDHLTLGADFIEKKGHLTKVDLDGKHRKALHLEASQLANGYYHLVTFFMKDGDLLMDALSKINCPEIQYESDDQKRNYEMWLEDAVSFGHCLLDFPNEPGFYCVQLLILPKDENPDGLAVVTEVVEDFLSLSQTIKSPVNTLKVAIPTLENCDFSICILTFRVDQALDLDHPFGFVLGRDPNKPFTPL
jgi:hypothetical protein